MTLQHVIYPVTAHTDHVGDGSTFVVIRGEKQDGLVYLQTALEKGASVIVMEHDHVLTTEQRQLVDKYGARIESVDNARRALAHLSAKAAGYPAEKLKIIGVTGTKGKTTICSMMAHMLTMMGRKTAVLTTAYSAINLGRDTCCGGSKPKSREQGSCKEGNESSSCHTDDTPVHLKTGPNYGSQEKSYSQIMPSSLTTPQPDFLHHFFKKCVEGGVEYVVMEVAVQAHTFYRLDGITFQAALFANLDQEHAEHYQTMEIYFQEKKKLFDLVVAGGVRVVNNDDAYARILASHYPDAVSYAHAPQVADYQFSIIESDWDMQTIAIKHNGSQVDTTFTGFPGEHNASNMVGAYGVLKEMGFKVDYMVEDGVAFPAIAGRLEPYLLPNGSCAIIDYAHTAGSFEKVLSFIRPRTKQLIVVFGAGGGKDSKKRPLMGAVASAYGDLVIVTDDNPRFDDPALIASQILSGVSADHAHKVIVEHDREAAIRRAYAQSDMGSVIVLFGKGPDEIQIVGNQRIPFSEKEILFSLI